ncbi:MAG: hypothetical protein WCT52_03225 [Candidatus Micrarchaeia archaeon]
MTDNKKEKTIAASDVPSGIAEIADIPAAKVEEKAEENQSAQPEQKSENTAQPVAGAAAAQPLRPRTQKEEELNALISKRQSVIEQLKAKNPLVIEARKTLSELIPTIRGRGSGHVMELVREEEHIEFTIATEAYTPKKEKELIKRLREIHAELSKHKELDTARKKVDEKRAILHNLISEIRTLETALADARKACDEKYAEVLAERKAAYSQRAAHREERPQRQFSDNKRRGREEHKREYDEDVSKYLKDYDDTVSMDEIVQIERKDKKEKKAGKEDAAEASDESSEQKEE